MLRASDIFRSPLLLFASNSRRTEPLSLLLMANKQICLSLGIQRHFRLGEDRAAAQEETTAGRCGLSSAREGRTKGIYDVHLSSLVPISSPVFSPLSLGQSLSYPSVLYRYPLSRLSTPILLIRLYHLCPVIFCFILHLFVRILSRVGRRKSYKCILGWQFYEEFGQGSFREEKKFKRFFTIVILGIKYIYIVNEFCVSRGSY